MQRIQDHIDACTHNYVEMGRTFEQIRDSIKDTNKLLMGFIAGVIAVVVTFAGYTYVQQQALGAQLAQYRQASTNAISQIPNETVRKLGAIPVGPPP